MFRIRSVLFAIGIYLLSQMAAAGPGGGQETARGTDFVSVSRLLGKTVKNTQGKTIGAIEDVIFEPGGRVDFLVLGYGGVFGLGDKMVPIPWPLIKDDLGSGKDYFVVNIDDKRLDHAPSFTGDQLELYGQRAGWKERVRKYYDYYGESYLDDPLLDKPSVKGNPQPLTRERRQTQSY